MEAMKFCQSCGMPLGKPEDFGSEKDGSPSRDYCAYCYKEGAFLQDCTMEEMIDYCVRAIGEFNKASGKPFSKEEAVVQMRQFFPTLKRWKQ